MGNRKDEERTYKSWSDSYYNVVLFDHCYNTGGIIIALHGHIQYQLNAPPIVRKRPLGILQKIEFLILAWTDSPMCAESNGGAIEFQTKY